ncbi:MULTISPECIES: phage tail sheath C-terminal domain-containing protein [unclassified Caballeronia]|uniref:phage tail sheath family protein n=1 Tax=unclassified Caballeronia TaxID=2646786 RepID=UPI00285FE16A|nr:MULTISPECIES: phage tail sheath C-terminal domain-containing protein [unclassified Caballeronia]MDR5816420.1 phage tail sheath C-terminal domain-containing protein [Caballeronia sp. LZ033]MDR5881218.1 phage tail sheath C-terminal domain-containing protein [Caballeronia sp. LZ032]
MTVVTSYPGIYIQEDASPALSVSQLATAVPLFCMNEDFGTSVIRFSSYLDMAQFFDGKPNFEDVSVSGLRAYFESGGGPCYAVSFESVVQAANLWRDSITLVVANGHDISTSVGSLTDPAASLFVVLDGPRTEITDEKQADGYTATSYAAVYYPWLTVAWSKTDIPPSAVMAGLYCKNDRSRGVWKAPANLALPGGYTPKFMVNDDLQGMYNTGRAINMIRTFNDTESLVWGARTLEDSDYWRYVSVRRLFNSVERDVRSSMNSMVFEPNTPPTWEKVRSAINSYLHGLWQQGGLAGASDEEAYVVQIGEGVTMSKDEIKQGKMKVLVGLAAARPAEFIILQFTQNMA